MFYCVRMYQANPHARNNRKEKNCTTLIYLAHAFDVSKWRERLKQLDSLMTFNIEVRLVQVISEIETRLELLALCVGWYLFNKLPFISFCWYCKAANVMPWQNETKGRKKLYKFVWRNLFVMAQQIYGIE